VLETNHYYHDYIDRHDNDPSLERDDTEVEMYVFMALTIQTGHGVRQTNRLLVNIGSDLHNFYSSTLKHDRYLHIFVTYILLTIGMNLVRQTMDDTRPD
jgi:hypothetical protein